jgi:predicted AAA+ superfamily ATPase
MSLPERGVAEPTVSLAALLAGGCPAIGGTTTLTTADYVHEIVASGFPGIRGRTPMARTALLAGYLDQIVEHDIPDMGARVRRPIALRGWLAAYGAATSTTASYASILNAATPGEDAKPAHQTAMAYRDLLQRLWILDPLPAWLPAWSHLKRLGQSPKHHLVDPALAAALAGATEASLIQGEGPARPDSTFLGSLFESLAVQTVRVLADRAHARTSHLRTQGGDQEIDIIVERADRRVVAIEVKSSPSVRPHDVRHLAWLQAQAGDLVLDQVVITTGERAYRRPDGIAVVPLALLGP